MNESKSNDDGATVSFDSAGSSSITNLKIEKIIVVPPKDKDVAAIGNTMSSTTRIIDNIGMKNVISNRVSTSPNGNGNDSDNGIGIEKSNVVGKEQNSNSKSSRSINNKSCNIDIYNDDDNDDFTAAILKELLEISNRNASKSRFLNNPILNSQTKHKFRSRSSVSSSMRLTSSSSSSRLTSAIDRDGHQRNVNEEKGEEKKQDTGNDTDVLCSANNHEDHYYIDDNSDANEEGQISKFLDCHLEKAEMNQYWYSPLTIQYLCSAIKEILGIMHGGNRHVNDNIESESKNEGGLTTGQRVAFLSTPSLYFAYPAELRKHCALFDIDKVWENDPGFVYYDFEQPERFDESLHHTFDIVVIDPPFITRDVWEKYAVTVNALLKFSPFGEQGEDATPNGTTANNKEESCEEGQRQSRSQQNKKQQHKKCGYVLATTVAENQSLMEELFDAKPTVFKPIIPHLVYQYRMYINFIDECNVLKEKNPEIYEN